MQLSGIRPSLAQAFQGGREGYPAVMWYRFHKATWLKHNSSMCTHRSNCLMALLASDSLSMYTKANPEPHNTQQAQHNTHQNAHRVSCSTDCEMYSSSSGSLEQQKRPTHSGAGRRGMSGGTPTRQHKKTDSHRHPPRVPPSSAPPPPYGGPAHVCVPQPELWAHTGMVKAGNTPHHTIEQVTGGNMVTC